MLKEIYGPCKLCGNTSLNLVLQATDFQILECNKCKIAFTNPPPTLPDYVNMDFHSGENKEKAEKLTYIEDLQPDWQMLIRMQAKMITDNFGKDANILEIGCGEGILLDEVRKAGFKNVEGIEPSSTGARRAIKKGLAVKNTYFNEGVTDKKFNLVMMSHVFEHIEDPIPFIKKVAGILKPNGSIMLTQTNYKALLPRFRKEKWYAWVPDQHFWHFTPLGLKKMFTGIGFKTTELNYCTLVHPRSKLYRIARKLPFLQDQFIILTKG